MITDWIVNMVESGVDINHIERMNSKTLTSMYPHKYYYDLVNKSSKPSHIKTRGISGLESGWETNDRTVYELFFSVIDDEIKGMPLNFSRVHKNYESLIHNGIDYQNRFYADASNESFLIDLPVFKHFEEDGLYFSNATHRTISAMMFGSPEMVGYVETYKRNPKKYNHYKQYKEICDKWYTFISQSVENIDVLYKDDLYYSDYTINLKDGYELASFENPIKFLDEKFLVDFDNIERMSKKVESFISILGNIDKEVTRYKSHNKTMRYFLNLFKRFRNKKLYEFIYELNYQECEYIHLDVQDYRIIDKIFKKINLHKIDAI
jgi:hypothetical protein